MLTDSRDFLERSRQTVQLIKKACSEKIQLE